MSYANRGQTFEQMIEISNKQYDMKGLATIQKVPTPWKVFYDKRKRSSRAIPEKKGTVDFVGVAKGKAIAFDAKSTKVKTRFPLDNIQDHQIIFLKRWKDRGGIAFILVEFAVLKETYILPIESLEKWIKQANRGGRKSIPHDWFVNNCKQVKSGNGILLDYLKILFRRKQN